MGKKDKLTELAEELLANGWSQIHLEYWPGNDEHVPGWKCFGVWDDGQCHIRIWARGRAPLEAMTQFWLKARAVKGLVSDALPDV